MASDSAQDQALVAVASTLRTDANAAEVIAALAAQEIPCIVLKGRAFAELFYPGGVRAYDDTDLLVPAAQLPRARDTLRKLGYVERSERGALVGGLIRPARPHAHPWDREADDAHIDLHERLNGATVDPATAWSVLAAHTTEQRLGRQRAAVLDRAASGMMCALHLAAHGLQPKPAEDMARAVRTLSRQEWESACAIAVALGAQEAFVTGLRFSSAGAALADDLGLPSNLAAERLLQMDPEAPSSAKTLETLVQQDSLVGWIRAVALVLVPPAPNMRRHHALARGGRLALSASYVIRLIRLVVRTPQTLRVWQRARRAARDRPAD